jgi:uncharacterized DUF497 family protein
VEFEWDDAKNRENLRKHRFGFEAAKLVFEDLFSITAGPTQTKVKRSVGLRSVRSERIRSFTLFLPGAGMRFD